MLGRQLDDSGDETLVSSEDGSLMSYDDACGGKSDEISACVCLGLFLPDDCRTILSIDVPVLIQDVQQVVGTSLGWARGINTLGKFFTPMCLCHQAV